jgi:hypothetical protein
MIRRNAMRLLVPPLFAAALAGCAPEAMNNRQATEFNAFLDRIATACQPLVIGSRDIGQDIRRGRSFGDDYDYFLDLTSRLYYGQITEGAYRSGITGFFGPGATTNAALDCIVANVATNRTLPPGAPPPLKR